MNARQLAKLGVPGTCVQQAIQCIQAAAKERMPKKTIHEIIEAAVKDPAKYQNTVLFGPLAKAILEEQAFVRKDPITYRVWGTDIDDGAKAQMEQACAMPNAVAAAIMPDGHIGYGLPIGGVLALDNAVAPFCVGVDIACRMKMSIFDIRPDLLDKKFNLFKEALEGGTRFGVGCEYRPHKDHAVMDDDWAVTKITERSKDRAYAQLGTSGSGNHFVEFGSLRVLDCPGLEIGKEYVALMSHSGSRGTGSAVCDVYSNIAQARLPQRYNDLGRLAWLDLDTEAGQEYWLAMELMGRYAAANHDIIHREVSRLLGESVMMEIENHHNFAFKERHFGKELIVHRKGATPAGKGVMGIIPGSMGTPGYVVRGLGNPDSLCSASHGAGRAMSRQKAKEMYSWQAVRGDLAKKGITVLAGGADEVPMAYKDIESVMNDQADLVERVAKFFPKIVLMCGDGSKAED